MNGTDTIPVSEYKALLAALIFTAANSIYPGWLGLAIKRASLWLRGYRTARPWPRSSEGTEVMRCSCGEIFTADAYGVFTIENRHEGHDLTWLYPPERKRR